jgi:hypothetical protein
MHLQYYLYTPCCSPPYFNGDAELRYLQRTKHYPERKWRLYLYLEPGCHTQLCKREYGERNTCYHYYLQCYGK